MIKVYENRFLTDDEIREAVLYYKNKYRIPYIYWVEKVGFSDRTMTRLMQKKHKLSDRYRKKFDKQIELMIKKLS